MNLNKYVKTFVALTIITFGMNTFAAPMYFTTKNHTKYQSNAKVNDTWSPYATAPNSENSVFWIALYVLCGPTATECSADIYMKTDDPKNRIFVGTGKMTMATGEIEPKRIENAGFVVTSPKPGVIEIRESESESAK